jgi:2-dehydropantoate 2-reductase
MRYIIYGAGGVGGVLGGRLHQAGRDVVLIARGDHLDAIRRDGLRLVTTDCDMRLPLPAVSHPREIDFRPDDVVILTMKTQDTEQALLDLENAGGIDLAVVCCQNGVENERIAARRYARVYGMVVYLWATFLEAGTVIGNTEPYSGVLHLGRYPTGVDPFCDEVATDLNASHFLSRPRPAIMGYKYSKLLGNIGTAIPALTGDAIGSPPQRRLNVILRDEAIACYKAAGITLPDEDELREVNGAYRRVAIEGHPSGEGSTWQSVMRGRTIETDYLNGEIVLLGYLHGVPTPLNAVIRQLTNQVAVGREKTGRWTADDLEAMAGAVPAQPGS